MFYPYKHFLKTLKQINFKKKVRIINRFKLNLTLIVIVTKPLKIGSWISLRFWSTLNRAFILTVNLFARYYQVLMVDEIDKLCQSFFTLVGKKSNQVNGNSRASVSLCTLWSELGEFESVHHSISSGFVTAQEPLLQL